MRVEITERSFLVDGREQLFLCGELHYFRMPRAGWEAALDRLVEAGCNAVAYYVPWFVHEYAEGAFDFTGETHPDNDLAAWIALTAQKGLIGFLRPGPYVYAECTDLGIPGWFLEKHPNARVKHWRGGQYEDYSAINAVGHNHPDFLAATRRWYAALAPVIRPHLAPAGNIALIQLCNEIPGDDHSDHNPENLGLERPDGLYPTFLREKYGAVAALNAHYGTTFEHFESVAPWQLEAARPEEARLENLDFYYGHYYPAYFARLRKMMLENGIDSVFLHNAYNPRAISLHLQNRRQNPWLNIGVDSYFSMSGSLNLKDLTYFCEYGAEYSRRFLRGAPLVLEQECGYWNDYPVVHGPELYLWNVWTIAGGYRGFNMYLFASGVNRPGMGFYGTSHHWQAPLDELGQPRAAFDDIKRAIDTIKANEAALTADNRYDIALGVKSDPGLIWKPVAKASSEAYYALRSEGYTPRLVDFSAPEAEPLEGFSALVVVADERMDPADQTRLRDYVAAGGRLLISGALPRLAMDGSPCTLLAESAGLAPGPKGDEAPNQQFVRCGNEEFHTGTVVQPVAGAGAAECLGTTRQGAPALWLAPVGKGMLLAAPFDIQVVMQATCRLLRLLLERLGAAPAIRGAKLLRALAKESGHLVVANPHPVLVAEALEVRGAPYPVRLNPYSIDIIPLEDTP
ncbi:beta-galactosidase [Ruminococcaceae bacterium OttesenSCG-928-D13]|nr:beta-galactosidase [Ruminococcaceae bacterium OttesenSCG-928-D13]